jgi:hypothetical protein
MVIHDNIFISLWVPPSFQTDNKKLKNFHDLFSKIPYYSSAEPFYKFLEFCFSCEDLISEEDALLFWVIRENPLYSFILFEKGRFLFWVVLVK